MTEIIPTEPDEGYSQQELEEQEAWLSELERQKIAEIDKHMQNYFIEIFGGHDDKRRKS